MLCNLHIASSFNTKCLHQTILTYLNTVNDYCSRSVETSPLVIVPALNNGNVWSVLLNIRQLCVCVCVCVLQVACLHNVNMTFRAKKYVVPLHCCGLVLHCCKTLLLLLLFVVSM